MIKTNWNRYPPQTATVVLKNGQKATGVIVEWYGPGECDVEAPGGTGRRRGVLVETYQRRRENAAARTK